MVLKKKSVKMTKKCREKLSSLEKSIEVQKKMIESQKRELGVFKGANIRLRARGEIDRTRRKEAEEREENTLKKATFCPHTKLLRKEAFREVGSHFFALAKRNKTPLTALYIDLNDFKEVNDRYGHPVGDKVLEEVAALFKSLLRESDIIGRDGGDEFFALLVGDNYENAVVVASKIEDALAEYEFRSNGDQFFLSAAIGVVEVSKKMETLEELIVVVDEEMYKIKRKMKSLSR